MALIRRIRAGLRGTPLLVAGLAVVSLGVGLIYLPAAVILAGLLIAALGIEVPDKP